MSASTCTLETAYTELWNYPSYRMFLYRIPEIEIDAQTFLEQNIDLIDHEDFNELYRRMPLSIVDNVTKILRECGINPLAR